MARERFGPYLLLKRLGQDALGEIYRAGRVQDHSVEQVSLLRILNGRGIHAPDLAQQLHGRAGIQQLLRSPNLGHGLDLGDFQGVPYVTYDYISGRDLASLMGQAHHRSHPVPTEHALLIAERIGLGLAMAYGSRLGSTPITHGFLVPHTIMVSNEGEIRILGFEFSQALRLASASGRVDEEFRRYLSPETLAGAAPSSADDVYSLGILLLELLSGRPLPDSSAEALQSAVQRVAAQGLPSIATLIHRSIAPAGERIDSTVTWHQLVSQLLEDGSMSSTPFHLAFYMHNLFRDEIALETAEIERERSIDLSKPELPAAAAAVAAANTASGAGVAGSTSLRETSELPTLDQPPATPPVASKPAAAAAAAESSPRRTALWIGLAAALLLIAGAAAFWWFQLRDAGDDGVDPQAATATIADRQAPEVTQPAAEPIPLLDDEGQPVLDETGQPVFVDPPSDGAQTETGLDQTQLLAQIDEMVAQRTEAVESNLRSQYDEEIQRLRRQVEEERQRRADEAAKIAEAAEAEKRAAEEAAARLEAERLAAAQEAARQKAAEEEATRQKQAEAAKATPPAPTAPEPEPVRRGQLVEVAGPDVVPPRLAGPVSPQYPYAAKRLRREADVEVRVLVDENGDVIDYRLDKKAGYGFDEAAVQAARQADFVPPTKAGVAVKMWTTIKISFRNE